MPHLSAMTISTRNVVRNWKQVKLNKPKSSCDESSVNALIVSCLVWVPWQFQHTMSCAIENNHTQKIKSASCDVLKHECGYSWFRKVPFVSTTLACDKHSYLMPASPRVSERESYWGNWRGSRTESSYPPPHIVIKTKKKELHSKPQTDPGLKLPNNSNTCEQNLLTCSSILKLFMGKLTLS